MFAPQATNWSYVDIEWLVNDQDRLGGQRTLRGLEPAAQRAHGAHQAQDPLRPDRVAASGGMKVR